MTKEELAEKTLHLILNGGNLKVIELLNDEALQLYPDPVFFIRRGVAFKNIDQFDKAIADYNKAIELKPDYADAYYNRARALDLKGEYDKAIADYNKAIALNANDPEYYNGLGVTLDNKGEYYRAIEEYNKALQLNPEYVDAITNQGVTWHNLKQYDKALALYSRAIAINPSYPLPYLNRGLTYEYLMRPQDALLDYNKALEINPGYPHSYLQMGAMLSRQGKHQEALKYYRLAYEHAPYSKYFKSQLDEATAKAGEAVNIENDETRFSAQYVEKEINDWPEEEKRPIRRICAAINEQVELIRKLMVYKGNAPVVHYTQLRTADILVMNKEAKMRYSNVVFMNDPEEGKVLLDFLLDAPLKSAFEKGTLQEDNNIYLGSFLPEDKADYLVMWRTYGKNEFKEEAAGCSITLKRRFFDKEDSGLYRDMRFGHTDPTDRQALYHVLYYDKEKQRLVWEGNNKDMVQEVTTHMKLLQNELAALLLLKDKKDKKDEGKKNMAINKFVFRYVSELRYFFKSADYQFEKELRVIKYYLPKDSAVKTDIRGDLLPRRLYIESTNVVNPHIAKIILGPKVPHPERWMYLDAVMQQNNHDTELEVSKCKFQ